MNKILIFSGIIFLGYFLLKKTKEKISPKIKTKAIVIGDSQTPFIVYNNKSADMIGMDGVDSLWSGGKGAKWLLDAVKNHSNDLTISHIFINIGTNGAFNLKDPIPDLIKNLKQKFPNAQLYYIMGSYGWGGNANLSANDLINYANIFEKNGVIVLKNAIGKTSNPHNNNLPSYKAIGKEIDEILK